MAQEQPRSNKLIETKDLLFVWKLITRNIGIILLIPILSYVVGYVYTYRLPNVYGVKAELLLKSNETYDYQNNIYQGLGAYGVYMDVQNQIRVLSSRDLLGEVVDKLDLTTSYYIVGRIKKNEVFGTGPFRAEVDIYNPGLYELPVSISIDNIKEYTVEYEVDGRVVKTQGEFEKPLQADDFRLTLFRNYSYSEENIGLIKSSDYEVVFHSRDYLISKYQGNLSIENIEHTSVLEVVLTDQLNQRAKVFLDTLTDSYIDYSERIQIEVNQRTLQNIEKQIDTVMTYIREKETELLNFRSQNEILDLDKQEEDYFNKYVLYTQQRRELERKKQSAIALRDYMKSTDDDRALPPFFYIETSDLYLQEAIKEIRDLQVKIEIRKTQESETNANILNLKKNIAMLMGDVTAYLDNLLDAMEIDIAATDEVIKGYEGDIKSLPLSAQSIANLQRELDVNNKMWLFLLEKKTNTLIARAGILPEVRIIQNTVSLGVIEPNKTKIIRLFVLGGFIISFLIALIRRLFFERIETVAGLREATSLNIIGGISQIKKEDTSLIVDKSPKSGVTESFRTMRTNLSYLSPKMEGAKAILVSSFHPGEGKTFCSTNLATIFAKSDKKVLLLDFDLHKPSVAKVCKIDNSKGISTTIIGKTQIDDVLIKDFIPNLDIIPAGPISPNPSELVLRNSVDDIFKWAEKNYDYIIIDTPPFGLLNDSNELVKYADTYLVILNARYTRRRGLSHIEEKLSLFEDTSCGVVLNGIKTTKLQRLYSRYAYKYSYNYNYGYGYGYGYGGEYGYGYGSDDSDYEEES